MSFEYPYTKSTCNLARLKEDIQANASITSTCLGGFHDEETEELTVIFETELDSGEVTALDSLVAAHTSEPPRDPAITKDKEYDRLLKKIESLERLLIKQVDGLVDDFVDDSGVDAVSSAGYVVKPGYVRCADGEEEAVVVTQTVETGSTKQSVTVRKHMFDGEGAFQVSADGGSSWQDVTAFGEPMALSGKKFKVKATLTGNDKLALVSLEVD